MTDPTPTPTAFMSYARFDDQHEFGHISELRDKLSAAVRANTGRDFHIFLDHKDIKWGEDWKQHIEDSLDSVTFLIPVVTPSFFESEHCRAEVKYFAERENRLGRENMKLILPIYYRDHEPLNDRTKVDNDEVVQLIKDHNYIDWRQLRDKQLDDQEVRKKLEDMALQIKDLLKQSPLPVLNQSIKQSGQASTSSPRTREPQLSNSEQLLSQPNSATPILTEPLVIALVISSLILAGMIGIFTSTPVLPTISAFFAEDDDPPTPTISASTTVPITTATTLTPSTTSSATPTVTPSATSSATSEPTDAPTDAPEPTTAVPEPTTAVPEPTTAVPERPTNTTAPIIIVEPSNTPVPPPPPTFTHTPVPPPTLTPTPEPVYVSVPNVIGSGADDASNTIRNAGLSPVRQLVSGGQCSPYAVLETAPAAGTSVVQGSVVQLKVCDPLLMPNLVGMNRDAAIGRLNALGVAYIVQETADSRYTKDEVWSTSPSAGQPILPGVTVTLNVIIHTGGSSGGGDNGGGGDFPDP